MNLNKVLLIGRLAADPESRTTPNGQTVVTLRVATNRVWNNRATGQKQEQVEFHTVIAWGGLADIASRYLRKGQLAFLEGRLQTRSWQGQDGAKRYRTEIVAENLQLGPKAAGYDNSQSMNISRPQRQNTQASKEESTEEDIPVIDEGAPVSNDPIVSDDELEEKEIDLKDIPF
ncbi:MAG: single-stranded DNA-binding protein [Candidatus Paceibacterota bacterium]